MSECSIGDCLSRVQSRGLCGMHYQRLMRHGDPLVKLKPHTRGPLEERFWGHVDRKAPDECWEWRLSRTPKGYGQFAIYGRGSMRNVRAHRFAWELANGPIPEGVQVLHRCDNPPCCNPAHLFLGSGADNMADRDRKGRTAVGERSGQTNLTESAVREMRSLRSAGWSLVALGDRYGVHYSTVSGICRGRTWRHLA